MHFFIQIVEEQQKQQLMYGEGQIIHIYKLQKQCGEDAYTQYSSSVTLTKDELIKKIKEFHSDIEINFENDNEIQILENTESGRVKKIKFGNIQISGVETRTIFGLKSANFTVKIEGDNIIFDVLGYGHGVGMSQTGADSMAKLGNNYEVIIKHYYTGVEIQNVS